jgi:hypothetical protein
MAVVATNAAREHDKVTRPNGRERYVRPGRIATYPGDKRFARSTFRRFVWRQLNALKVNDIDLCCLQ